MITLTPLKNNGSHSTCRIISVVTLYAAIILPLTLQAQEDQQVESRSITATMTVDLLDRVAVSSSVDGVIQHIGVRVGETVKADQLLIQIDTARFKKERNVAADEYDALRIKSENDSRERVNLARERTAQFNVAQLNKAAAVYQVSVPALEISRAESELDEATSERLGAGAELEQFRAEANAKQREIELLDFDIEKSQILSQYEGALTRIERRVGEFVEKGATIAELYRLDRLTGAVLIRRDDLLPEEAENVRGELVIPHPADKRSYPVTIKRVLPRVDVDGKYRAVVELENEQTPEGKWRLLPGMVGQVSFELKMKKSAEATTEDATTDSSPMKSKPVTSS